MPNLFDPICKENPEKFIVTIQTIGKKYRSLSSSILSKFHTNTIQIHYKLNNGTTVQRYYEIPHTGALAEQAKMYFSDIRYLFKTNDPESLYTSLGEVTIGYDTVTTYESEFTSDREILTGLLDAIKADCELGLIAQNWLHYKGDGEYHLSFTIKTEEDDYFHKWSDMYITNDCKNTVAYLQTIIPLKAE